MLIIVISYYNIFNDEEKRKKNVHEKKNKKKSLITDEKKVYTKNHIKCINKVDELHLLANKSWVGLNIYFTGYGKLTKKKRLNWKMRKTFEKVLSSKWRNKLKRSRI